MAPQAEVGGDYLECSIADVFATLDCELLERFAFRERHKAYVKIDNYIERLSNGRRRHSTIGNVASSRGDGAKSAAWTMAV